MAKQSITQDIKQTQRLSPVQLMLVPLLQMNSLEIEEKVRGELDDNPALEINDDPASSFDNNLDTDEDGEKFSETADDIQKADYSDEDDIPFYRTSISNRSADDEEYNAIIISQTSLVEYLTEQIHERKLNDTQQRIAEYIIGNIDDSGYLSRTISSIADDIIFQTGLDVPEKQVREVLSIVQDLDPAGVGALDIQECLQIQLRRRIAEGHHISKLSLKVITDHFDKFTKKHFDRIISALGIDESTMTAINDDIISLTPKPGTSITGIADDSHAQQITPDFIIDVDGENITVTLVNNIPELQISESYSSIHDLYAKNKPKTRKDTEAALAIKENYEKARDFISVLRMRQETLFNTMRSITLRQRTFFIEGDETKIKPMILKDIAQDTGYDLSVISRAITNKYASTQWGIFPLKYFFNEGLHHESGDDVSSREILSILKTVISEENKSRPYSDEQLCNIMKKRGYIIARRTIAKYREKLAIPVSRLRKQI